MPEGPEVKKMGLSLAENISGEVLRDISILSGRYSKKPIAGLSLLLENLPTKIVGVGVHGKFLYILTSKGYNVWSTLGMAGVWSPVASKHARIELMFESGKSIYFSNKWRPCVRSEVAKIGSGYAF